MSFRVVSFVVGEVSKKAAGHFLETTTERLLRGRCFHSRKELLFAAGLGRVGSATGGASLTRRKELVGWVAICVGKKSDLESLVPPSHVFCAAAGTREERGVLCFQQILNTEEKSEKTNDTQG